MLALGTGLAIFASWYQWAQTRKCLDFFGSDVAHRIQVAPRVELWRVGTTGEPEAGGAADVSRARGLVHLRRGLVEDANFAWDGSGPPGAVADAFALAFFDDVSAASPATVLVVRLGERSGTLEVAGRPGALGLGRIAPGLRTWLADARGERPQPPPQSAPQSPP